MHDIRLRAMMMEVINGEYGDYRYEDGIAVDSHPWLLNGLRESMGIPEDEVHPLPETITFLADLERECGDPLTGVAALGVGNELMILEEYSAIERAFVTGWPNAEYRPFLRANIAEDAEHSRILADVGAILIARGGGPNRYLEAAKRSVDSRFVFYDSLLARVQSLP